MKDTTKLAIGATVGLAVLGVAAYALSQPAATTGGSTLTMTMLPQPMTGPAPAVSDAQSALAQIGIVVPVSQIKMTSPASNSGTPAAFIVTGIGATAGVIQINEGTSVVTGNGTYTVTYTSLTSAGS